MFHIFLSDKIVLLSNQINHMNLVSISSLTQFLIILFIPFLVNAQPKVIGQPEVFISSEETNFMKPLWSPDGNAIAFTSTRHEGIWMANNSGSDIRQVTKENAGYGFTWSSDAKSILARVSEYQNKRQQHAITIYSLDDNSERRITEFRNQMPALPQWADFDQQVVLISDNSVESFSSGKVNTAEMKMAANKLFYVLKSNKIAAGKVPLNSTEDISPFEDAQYLNLEVSPDGRKLSFEIYGGNLYVMNIDGSGLIDLGKANRAKWAPDSNYLVAMEAEDNGYDYTRSDIIALSIDGSQRINLTESTDMLATNPDWSPKGDKIAFDSPQNGAIYILNLDY